MTDEATDLLPCPFCGGKAAHSLVFADGVSDNVFAISCERCLASVPAGEKLNAKAIAAWNTRAESAALAEITAERDRLRAALGEIATHDLICLTGPAAIVAGAMRGVAKAALSAPPTEKETS